MENLEEHCINVGDKFLCFKSSYYDGLRIESNCIFKKGEIYHSERIGCITDYCKNREHLFTKKYWTQYLIKINYDKEKLGDTLEMLNKLKKYGYTYDFKTKEIKKHEPRRNK